MNRLGSVTGDRRAFATWGVATRGRRLEADQQKRSTYRSQARNLPREPCFELFWNAFKVKGVLGKYFSVVLLPQPNCLDVLGCWSLDVLADFQGRPSVTGSDKLSLERGRLPIGRAFLKDLALERRRRDLPARCGRLYGQSLLLYHLSLLWRLILLLCNASLSSWPFGAMNKRAVWGVGCIRNASQWCSWTTGRHFDERIMWRGWYEYGSCHS